MDDAVQPATPKVTAIFPKLLDAAQSMISEAKARNLGIFGIESGLRDPDHQDYLYSLGRTVKNPDGACAMKPMGEIVTNAKGWQSLHNFGLAVDVVPKNLKGEWYWPKDDNPVWEELGKIGEIFGLAWGGRWSLEKIDRDHFEMRPRGLSLLQMKLILFTEGIEKVWSLV